MCIYYCTALYTFSKNRWSLTTSASLILKFLSLFSWCLPAACNGFALILRILDKWIWTIGGTKTHTETPKYSKKSCPSCLPLLPPRIRHRLQWGSTRSSAVRSRRLMAWHTEWKILLTNSSISKWKKEQYCQIVICFGVHIFLCAFFEFWHPNCTCNVSGTSVIGLEFYAENWNSVINSCQNV